MYFFPGYIVSRMENDRLYISSKLLENEVEISETTLQQEFYSILQKGGCRYLNTPLTVFLHEQELLLNEIEINQALEKYKRLLNDALLLTIMPTESCNFRCPYCYEAHTPELMSKEILNQIQRFIADQVPCFNYVHIDWFGGEPTLCKDIILETNDLVQRLQVDYAFRFGSGMTSNGYLLDAESFQQYFKVGITNYQITLDGWDHDTTRPHVSGKGTLHTILNNLCDIAALPKDKYPFHITLRHNILADDLDFSWYDYLNELFGADSRFSVLVTTVTDWGGETVKNLNLSPKQDKENLKASHEAYLDKIGMLREFKENIPFSNICFSSCPHGFIFRPNGKIEKCTIALNHPRNLIGSIDPINGVMIDNKKSQLWCLNELDTACYTCPDVLSCLNLCCRKSAVIDNQMDAVCPHPHSLLDLN